MSTEKPEWDVFISHAWEDKDDFVRPLAEALKAQNVKVWFDEFTLTLGDSLRGSIDEGLRDSRFGVVVFSHAFFEKWSAYELDGLVNRQVSEGKVILPIWHNITREDIMKQSPSLANLFAVPTNRGLNIVVQEIMKVLKKSYDASQVIPQIPDAQLTNTSSATPTSSAYRAQLRETMTKLFNLSELKTICFDLGVEYDDLPHTNRTELTTELIAYLERVNRLKELVQLARRLRPNATF